MRRTIRTALVATAIGITALATWSWATATAGPPPDYFVMPVTVQEDDPTWDCQVDGNRQCHETLIPHPIHITGHLYSGFTVVWSDGHTSTDGPWSDILRECHHDQAPAVCVTAWYDTYRKYAEERAILRWLR